MRKIIIPVAGKATRFNGILKEFAPIGEEFALERTARMAIEKFGATHIVFVSNAEKLVLHYEFIQARLISTYPEVHFNITIQTVFDRDLWDAIYAGLLAYPQDVDGGLLLPDSVFDVYDTLDIDRWGIQFGTFMTDEPKRFSILTPFDIITKPDDLSEGMYNAWGVVLWDEYVTKMLIDNNDIITHYDKAFSAAMNIHGYSTFNLKYYYDIGSIEKYIEFLEETQ